MTIGMYRATQCLGTDDTGSGDKQMRLTTGAGFSFNSSAFSERKVSYVENACSSTCFFRGREDIIRGNERTKADKGTKRLETVSRSVRANQAQHSSLEHELPTWVSYKVSIAFLSQRKCTIDALYIFPARYSRGRGVYVTSLCRRPVRLQPRLPHKINMYANVRWQCRRFIATPTS